MQIGFCHWEGRACLQTAQNAQIYGSPKAVRIFLEYEDVASATKAGGLADKTPAAFYRCEIAAESCYDPSRDVFKDYLYSEG